jgi:hypothetical protein
MIAAEAHVDVSGMNYLTRDKEGEAPVYSRVKPYLVSLRVP